MEVLYPEYHWVLTQRGRWPVTIVMLRHVERELARWPRPRWITFVDLSGARVRIRSRVIEGFEQSTPESRALFRRVCAEQDQEENL